MRTKAIIFPILVSFLFFQSCRQKEQTQVVNSENALESYIAKPDTAFQWSVTDSFELESIKGYQLIMTSQVWQGITWKHQLTVFVPTEVDYTNSLLFISGGKNKEGEPTLRSNTDDLATDLASIAIKNKAVVSLLRQTPNQPLFGDLTEDALISQTLHNFKNDGDYNWPLLFPMVKSAIRGMDAVQQFGEQNLNKKIEKFTISGYSKRGWTTWLTGSQDSRVEAIGPMVIDVLNMPVSLQYQISTWNDYSIEIQDYVALEIPQSMASDTGSYLVDMIDPYSYRKKLTMPKMIFIGTNDPYWPIDAIKNYYDSIPGENYIHYVPNAGHDLAGGKQAMEALGAFFGNTIQKKAYPKCTWTCQATEKGLAINVKTSADRLVDVIVWTANSEDRDFRDDEWTSKSLGIKNVETVDVLESYAKGNFKAQYIDLKYQDVTGGTFTESTRVFVTDTNKLL